MKTVRLHRYDEGAERILGRLYFGETRLHALERPWLPDAPGGTPSLSCIPAGRYRILRHTRPSGAEVIALVNHGLGVYYLPDERPNQVGRYLVLVHVANYVNEIEGCIAVGMEKAPNMVTHSRDAMARLMEWLGDDEAEIEINGSNGYTEAS